MPHSNLLRVFVYGTLKQGYWNHAAHLGGFVRRENVVVRGRLWLRATVTPILEVPRASILAYGTMDYASDLATQNAITERLKGNLPPDSVSDPGGWGWVQGELYTLDPADRYLRGLDELEDYVPGGASLYERALLPIGPDAHTTAWAYVMPAVHSGADYRRARNPQCWRAEDEGHPRARRPAGGD